MGIANSSSNTTGRRQLTQPTDEVQSCSTGISKFYMETSAKSCVLRPIKYCFCIHQRNVKVDDRCSKISWCVGHFFLSLEKNGEAIFFGKHPERNGIKVFYDREKIKTMEEAQSFSCLTSLQERDNKPYVKTKTIILNEEEYEKALKYAKSKCEGEVSGIYKLWGDNCTDFIQEVYNIAGLPLYFTSVFRTEDLDFSPAAKSVRKKYGSLDQFDSIFINMRASNENELVTKLNVNEDDVLRRPDGTFFVDIDDALEKIMHNAKPIYSGPREKPFKLPEKYTKSEFYELRVNNMINFVKAKLQSNYDTNISTVCENLAIVIKKYPWCTNEKYVSFVEGKKQKLELKSMIDKANARERIEAINEAEEGVDNNLLLQAKIAFIEERNKSSQKHMETELRSKVESMMLNNVKEVFQTTYDKKLNESKKHIIGIINSSNEENINFMKYRTDLLKQAEEFLENIRQMIINIITNDFQKLLGEALELISVQF